MTLDLMGLRLARSMRSVLVGFGVWLAIGVMPGTAWAARGTSRNSGSSG
jgi:hypothetical protein